MTLLRTFYLTATELRRAWQRHRLCPSFVTLARARIWCQRPGSHKGRHLHDEIEWEDPLAGPLVIGD